MKPGDLVSVYLNDGLPMKTGLVIRHSRKVLHVGEVIDILIDGEIRPVLREHIHLQRVLDKNS